MNARILHGCSVGICLTLLATSLATPSALLAKEKSVVPLAVLPFDERGSGAKDLGLKVTDLLFAKLVANPDIFLVDRADLKKSLEEQHLGVVGAVDSEQAAKVGRLTGAKILVTGSVIHVDKSLILVAKIIGVETTRVLGASIEGRLTDELPGLVGRLANDVSKVVLDDADKLVPAASSTHDALAKLRDAFSKQKRASLPTLHVQLPETHVGAVVVDPAAQTELIRIAKEVGFTVLDGQEGSISKADVLVRGEAFSETCGRFHSLVAVKGRVEIKLIRRATGEVIAADHQSVVVVDAAELSGGKQALQNAAALLTLRNLASLGDALSKAKTR